METWTILIITATSLSQKLLRQNTLTQAVTVGYDLERRGIVLRSGKDRRHVNPFSTFKHTRKRGEYWTLVISPADKIPATATELAFLKAASEMESLGKLNIALTAYDSAIEQWPGNIIARLGKGNILYQQKNYITAEKVFRDALDIKPSDIKIWNNLSYTLTAMGCNDQAKSAIECASRLLPDNHGIQESLREIHALDAATAQCKNISCPIP